MLSVLEKEISDSQTDHLGTPHKKVVYLGEKGSFSHKACLAHFGNSLRSYPVPSFREIFEEVKNGDADYGIIPIENSLCGSIHENYDLLLEYELYITGELSLRVVHNLIARPGVQAKEIKRVFGPPPALDQCRKYLAGKPDITLVPVNATASAVKRVAESGSGTDAAIASMEAAEIFSMNVLEESIEDNPRNYTRFVIIEKEPAKPGPKNKSSIVFSTLHQPGELLEVMKIISESGINLVKLESRPIHGKPWQYMFYADLETDITDRYGKKMLNAIKLKTDYLKTLGSYQVTGPATT